MKADSIYDMSWQLKSDRGRSDDIDSAGNLILTHDYDSMYVTACSFKYQVLPTNSIIGHERMLSDRS